MTAQKNRPSEAEAAMKTFGGVTDNDTPGGYGSAIERLPLNQLIEEATTAYLAVLDRSRRLRPQRSSAICLSRPPRSSLRRIWDAPG